MGYPNEIRLFYSPDVNPELLGLDTSLAIRFNPIGSKPKLLTETKYGENLYWTAELPSVYPFQLQVSYIFAEDYRGRGTEEVDDPFVAFYNLIRRFRGKDSTVVEVLQLASLEEDEKRYWYDALREAMEKSGSRQ